MFKRGRRFRYAIACGIVSLVGVVGCGSTTESFVVTGGGGGGPAPVVSHLYQNPFMSPNPGNNIHNDSYLSDTYAFAGPTSFSNITVQQNNLATFVDPYTGEARSLVLGEAGAQTFDAQGNVQILATGMPNPQTGVTTRSLVTLDRTTLGVLAWYPFEKEGSSATDFSGGYFYQDHLNRLVVALPDGHVKVMARRPSTVSSVDTYVAERDINVTGLGGAVPVPAGLDSLSLYVLMPDKQGNIWFTTGEGIVGVIGQDNSVRFIDTNDVNGTGVRTPQPDGDFQGIANSHSVDEGDSAEASSGVYVLTTHKLYRFGLDAGGNITVDWETDYDRGTQQKSGQVSHGSGTSPTVFRMGGRRFVTIADNATDRMNVNVYRAETTLETGEQRLFAQVAPFGDNPEVSDENSLIVAPAPDNSGGYDIFAENNFGYDGFASVAGPSVTEPGFARMRLLPSGSFTVASVNSEIRVPTVVSKMSTANNTVYTYEKRTDGWYFTGLDAADLNKVHFAARVGPSSEIFNNHYAALSLDADGRSAWIGTVLGVTKVTLTP